MSSRKLTKKEVAAIADIERKIKHARNQGKMAEAAEFYNQLGNQYRLLGKYEEALEAHEEEINICKNHNKGDKMALAIAFRNKGEVLMEMKDDKEAIDFIKLYLGIAKKDGNLVEEQRAKITLGRAYLSMAARKEISEETDDSENHTSSTSLLDLAYRNFRQAYELLNNDEIKLQLQDDKELMRMKCSNCQNLGLALESQGNFAVARQWITKAIDIGNKYKFYEYLAPCYTVLCTLLLKDKNWKDALEAAKNATKTAKTLGNEVLEIESRMLEAKVLFMTEEVDAGKKILKKLRQNEKLRKKTDLSTYFEEIDSQLIAAVRICRTLDNLYEESEEKNLMKLHEILGDNFSTLQNYETAVRHYMKASELAKGLDVGKKKLSRLYFSIAESYNDLEDYEKALRYYEKEIKLHEGNAEEEFKTQSNIAMVLEKLKKPVEEIIKAYKEAVEFARVSKNLTKQITALTNLSIYLKSILRKQEAEKYDEEASNIKSRNNIIDLDESDPDSQDLLEDDYIDLNDLSEEDDSDDEVEDDKKATKKRVGGRVNELGETKLHVAAKKGELKTVRRLIREGHAINAKDNAGWTPLHEACNHGFVDIVKELIKNGASFNDPGGDLTEKITPLHDAAWNCHCEVIEVLIESGANVLAKDAMGRYPIDSLIAWRESEEGQQCDKDTLVAYRRIKELLKEQMAQAGRPYRAEDEKRSRRKARVEKKPSQNSNQLVLLATKEYEEDCPAVATTIVDDYDPDEEGNGEEFYKSAIKQVGRKPMEKRGTRKEKARPISPGPRGALIPSEKDFHQRHEDWLLPDNEDDSSNRTRSFKPKRKRDPFEDVMNVRNTRRKGFSDSRQKDYEEASPITRGDEADFIEDDIEPMDIASPSSVLSPSNESESLNIESEGIETAGLGQGFGNEDYSTLLGDDFGLDGVGFDVTEQDGEAFLPSQITTSNNSTVEFGKTKDIPILEDSDELCDRKAKNLKRHRTITISSDEDNDSLQTTSRGKDRVNRLSNILKQSNSNKLSRKDKSNGQARLPVKLVPRPRTYPDSDSNDDEAGNIPSSARLRRSSSLKIEEKQKEVLRLKIRILDKVLLVLVDETHIDETIDWLAEETSRRYQRECGVKPILSLQTKDGATLSGADPISLVLDANERELNGVVISFNLPPLVERYCTECTESAIKVVPEIKSCLNNCQSSNILNLCNENLRGKSAIVLMTALQRQNALRVLVLSGCSLQDNGILELCKALPTLSGLVELDVSSNGITSSGFIALADVFLKGNQSNETAVSFCSVPFGLTALILSHNPLGNRIGAALVALLNKLHYLKRLEMSDCDLSDKLFLGSQSELSRVLNNSRIEELDISFNDIKETGLEKCLLSLPARRIRTLNCSSCGSSYNNSTTNDGVAKAVGAFLSGNEDCCNLTTLKLNDCGLNDKSMELIIDNFDRLVRLESLELACNDKLTALSLVNILECSVEREIPLTRLDLGSVPDLWSTQRVSNERVLNAIAKKLNSQKKLAELRVPISDQESEIIQLNEDGSQSTLPSLEQKIVELMSDYAGNTNFCYERQLTCMIYRFEDN